MKTNVVRQSDALRDLCDNSLVHNACEFGLACQDPVGNGDGTCQ